MIRFIFAAPLIGHGIAHLSGFLASWSASVSGFSGRPWLFSSDVTLQSPVGRAFSLLWLVAMIGCVGAGVGWIAREEWWSTLAITACAISLLAIVPWWKTVPPGAWAGAVFDLLVIILLLLPLKENILDIVK